MEAYNKLQRREQELLFAEQSRELVCRQSMFAEEKALRRFYEIEARRCHSERWMMRTEEELVGLSKMNSRCRKTIQTCATNMRRCYPVAECDEAVVMVCPCRVCLASMWCPLLVDARVPS